MLKKTIYSILLYGLIMFKGYSQIIIPNNVFTHIAIKNGNWNSKSTWNTGTIPSTGAIVRIPNGKKVNYNVVSTSAHIFVIKNEGEFNVYGNTNKRKLIVDTFYNTPTSKLNITATSDSASDIDIEIRPYDILKKVNNNNNYGGIPWSNTTLNYFTNGENQPVYDHFGKKIPSDGSGVYGRYKWDKNQVSLCLMTMGIVRIKGTDKLDFSELSGNVPLNSKTIFIKSVPKNWKVGDKIVVTGTKLIGRDADEVFTITNINGTKISIDSPTKREHKGVTIKDKSYFPYVANLTRNIKIHSTFTETQTNITKRGHTMFMLNGDIQIINTLFKDLGRTDKSNIVDDLKLGVPTITGTGNARDIEFNNANLDEFDAIQNIENQRGRYSFHFHKSLRGLNSEKLIIARGNVVWGSPGWGMVHHDSHADFSDNVVFDIEGGGMIAESGSETGIWRKNLVVNIRYDATSPFLPNNEPMTSPIRRTLRVDLDDDFKGGAAYGMQGRAVKMLNNIATTSGVAFHYQGSGENSIVADKVDTSIFEKEGMINPFPLDSEIVRTAVPLIQFKGNKSIGCSDGFKSQNRLSGSSHRVLSIVDQLTVINASRFGIYISSNFGYLIKNSIIHQSDSNLTNTASGILIQKDNDNINLNYVRFHNFTTDGAEVEAKEGFSQNNPAAKFIFNKVFWLNNSGENGIHRLNHKDPYPDPNEKVQIKTTNFNPNEVFDVSFVKHNDMDDEINLNGSLEFNIKGNITDKAGTVNFANLTPKNAPSMKRTYKFNSKSAAQSYINNHGGIKNEGSKKYFNFIEYISNRVSGNITPVKLKIYVKNYTNLSSKEISTKESIQLNNEGKNSPIVYPNPSKNGFITVLCQQQSSIKIFNINGGLELSFDKSANDDSETNIQQLSSGVYYITISTEETVKTQKLIVK